MQVAEAKRRKAIAQGKDEKIHGLRLSECARKYLDSRHDELSDKTKGQHELLLTRLEAFCAQRGVYFARELTVDLLEDFKTEGLSFLASTSKSTAVAKLRCFLRDAYRRGWITEPLVEKIKPSKAVYDQKDPYTDEEISKILAEAEKLNGGTRGYARYPKTFRALLDLMLETGMRVGDAIRFNPAALTKGEHLWIYTYTQQKQKRTEKQKTLEAFLSDKLKRSIDKCQRETHWPFTDRACSIRLVSSL